VSQQRLGIVLEAIAFSPIRPYVAMAQVPSEPTKELLDIIRKIADRIPEIAARLGIEPPEKGKGRKKRRPKRPPRPDNAAKPSPNQETEPSTPDVEATAPDPDAETDTKSNTPPDNEPSPNQETEPSTPDVEATAPDPDAATDTTSDTPPDNDPSPPEANADEQP
jgi:hypothetical protein